MKRKGQAARDGQSAAAKPAKSSNTVGTAAKTEVQKDQKAKKSEGLSERRLKQYSLARKDGAIPLTVGLTGARAGDVLRGVEDASGGDARNVVLRLVAGEVAAPAIIRRSVEAELGRDRLVAAVAKRFGLSHPAAELRYRDFPSTECPNHQPLGSGCGHGIEEECSCPPAASFVIVSQGVWQGFAEMHGNGGELQVMVSERRVVCWRDVLKLMYTPGLPEGKKLLLRPRLFEIVAGPEEVAPTQLASEGPVVDGYEVWKALDTAWPSTSCYLRLHDALLVKVPRSAAEAWQLDVSAICRALQGEVEACEVQVKHCLNHLKTLSLGGLKSCLQKLIRFHAASVRLTDDKLVPAPMLAAVVMAMLFASKGGFSPELQLFTRGCTAALKRLAVILLEDGWIEAEETAQHIRALLVLGLVTQRMHDYEPPAELLVGAMRLAARAQASRCVIAWRRPKGPEPKEKRDRVDHMVLMSEEQQEALQSSAQLLRMLRSFPGDMDMFDTVAQHCKSGHLRVEHAEQRPEVMPLCHIVDQHTFRGIGHVLGDAGETFTDRFQLLFQKCTGCNPRLEDLSGFESRKEVQMARFAQSICLNMALQRPRKVLPIISEGVHVKLELDTGVLAAAVGPLPVTTGTSDEIGSKKRKQPADRAPDAEKGSASRRRKLDLLLLLGLRCPEDEVVMQKPVRATRDLFGELSDQQRNEASRLARSQQHRLQSPLLPNLKHATYSLRQWAVDGRPWTELQRDGVKSKVPLVSSPWWCDLPELSQRMPQLLEDDEVLLEALNCTGAGIIRDAQQVLIRMSSAVDHGISLRAMALLRQQYSSIAMPTPSLQGTADGVGLAAYDGDWRVYRFLVLVSRVMPAALRPQMPPNFQVLNPAASAGEVDS